MLHLVRSVFMPSIHDSAITIERRGKLLLIGLNRTAKRNAFDPPMFHELARALGELEPDPELWCGVVFAHGDHFTGGIDLAQFAPLFELGFQLDGDPFALGPGEVGYVRPPQSSFEAAGDGGPWDHVHDRNRDAFGREDIRIAAANTRFAQLEVARGLYPLGGATFRLVREAGWGNAMRYLLTGDEFGAEEALRLGLVQEIVATGRQLEQAIAIAERIAAQAPLGVRATLRSARMAIAEGETAAAAHVRDDLAAVLKSDDFREGVNSFKERRAARFRGR